MYLLRNDDHDWFVQFTMQILKSFEENEVKIPYTIPLDTPVFHRRQIQRAIDEFSLKTCIKFIPRNEEQDYVLIDTIN